ncbi:hypothetical protein JYU34_005043 [Plutella xylostella]|uniref:CARD domain-containing protein n=1 Tax=Plutella xylostella TaxID=51655 RepID=A0ABQ7QVP7_PLUXY|nr:hypothetical protein JYU34_005043 [Plutella xylostella]
MAVVADVCAGLLRHKTTLLRELTDTNILDVLVKKGIFNVSDHELITSAVDAEKCNIFIEVVSKQSGVKLSELCTVLEKECSKLTKELINDRHRLLTNVPRIVSHGASHSMTTLLSAKLFDLCRRT